MDKRNDSPTTTNTGKGPYRRLHRLSPSLVIASIALFASLGGVGYAAATGSIDSREIKNSTIRTKDVRNNDLRGTDIRTGAVRSSDVADNDLTGADVLESSLGTVPSAAIAGAANSANSANNANALGGVAAASYPRAIEIVTANSAEVTPTASADDVAVTATCPAGKRVIGGGANSSFTGLVPPGTVLNVALQDSVPSGETGWRAFAVETGATDETLAWRATAVAICALR